MEVHLTPEQEAQLAANAGTDTERLVKDTVLRFLTGNGDTSKAPNLSAPIPCPCGTLAA